jgi:hypothetical protein
MADIILTSEGAPPYRGGTPAGRQRFAASSISLNWSWGSEPSSANITYVGENSPPVVANNWLDINVVGHTFYGFCVSDVAVQSSSGNTRKLTFTDNRDYLKWDNVYGAWNMPIEQIVSGRRVKRYWHVLPSNYNIQRKTFTNSPYTAAEILDFIFNSVTVEDPWVRSYHSDQLQFPVYSIDAMNGMLAASAITQISQAQGLQFTLMGGRFRLVWMRRGEGILPAFTADSDNREAGTAVSGNPTRVRILGERNLYQVHDISMIPDWRPKWQQFYDSELFIDDIFNRGKSNRIIRIERGQGGFRQTYAAGQSFRAIAESAFARLHDKEQLVTRQLARAMAMEMSVVEYAELRGDVEFLDNRKFQGKSRNDMPAMLYIQQLVFRAFRFPLDFQFRNRDGQYLTLSDVKVSSKMVSRVRHEPLTGKLNWITTESHDGQGYAIIKGYAVGSDLFKNINPDRFKIEDWNESQDVWERIDMTVDDSGEDFEFIVFNDPVIRSSDLVELVDNHVVFKAKPTLTVPPVRLAITFEGERFSYIKGDGTRDAFTHVPGLNAHHVSRASSSTSELSFADGRFANAKADDLAVPILNRQFFLTRGKFDRRLTQTNGVWPAAVQLTGMIDRVTLSVGPNGVTESVHLTNEAPRETFVPEKDLDRKVRDEGIFAGEKELRNFSNIAIATSIALQTKPTLRTVLNDAFNDNLGGGPPPVRHAIAPPPPAPAPVPAIPAIPPGAIEIIEVGTPIFRKPFEMVNGERTGTAGILPKFCFESGGGIGIDPFGQEITGGPVYTIFMGVTVRSREEVEVERGGELSLQLGQMLVRVKGPVAVGEKVGRSSRETGDLDAFGQAITSLNDYLAPGGDFIVATAQQKIETDEVKLIQCQSIPHSNPVHAIANVIYEYDDFLLCSLNVSGDFVAGGLEMAWVAKPNALRSSRWNPGWLPGQSPTLSLDRETWVRPGSALNGFAVDEKVWMSLNYQGPSMRYRVTGKNVLPGANNSKTVVRQIDRASPDLQLDYTSSLEVVYPPYGPGFSATGTSGHPGVLPTGLYSPINVVRMPMAVDFIPQDVAVWGPWANTPIRWVDMNVDARHFVPIKSQMVNPGDMLGVGWDAFDYDELDPALHEAASAATRLGLGGVPFGLPFVPPLQANGLPQ